MRMLPFPTEDKSQMSVLVFLSSVEGVFNGV